MIKKWHAVKVCFFSFTLFLALSHSHSHSRPLSPSPVSIMKIVAVLGPTTNRNQKPAKWEYACVTSYNSQIQNFNYFVNTCDYRVVSSEWKTLVQSKNVYLYCTNMRCKPFSVVGEHNETFAADKYPLHRGHTVHERINAHGKRSQI